MSGPAREKSVMRPALREVIMAGIITILMYVWLASQLRCDHFPNFPSLIPSSHKHTHQQQFRSESNLPASPTNPYNLQTSMVLFQMMTSKSDLVLVLGDFKSQVWEERRSDHVRGSRITLSLLYTSMDYERYPPLSPFLSLYR